MNCTGSHAHRHVIAQKSRRVNASSDRYTRARVPPAPTAGTVGPALVPGGSCSASLLPASAATFPETKPGRIHNPLICSRFFARVPPLALSRIHRRGLGASVGGSRSSRFEVLISIDLRLQAAPLIRCFQHRRTPTPTTTHKSLPPSSLLRGREEFLPFFTVVPRLSGRKPLLRLGPSLRIRESCRVFTTLGSGLLILLLILRRVSVGLWNSLWIWEDLEQAVGFVEYFGSMDFI